MGGMILRQGGQGSGGLGVGTAAGAGSLTGGATEAAGKGAADMMVAVICGAARRGAARRTQTAEGRPQGRSGPEPRSGDG